MRKNKDTGVFTLAEARAHAEASALGVDTPEAADAAWEALPHSGPNLLVTKTARRTFFERTLVVTEGIISDTQLSAAYPTQREFHAAVRVDSLTDAAVRHFAGFSPMTAKKVLQADLTHARFVEPWMIASLMQFPDLATRKLAYQAATVPMVRYVVDDVLSTHEERRTEILGISKDPVRIDMFDLLVGQFGTDEAVRLMASAGNPAYWALLLATVKRHKPEADAAKEQVAVALLAAAQAVVDAAPTAMLRNAKHRRFSYGDSFAEKRDFFELAMLAAPDMPASHDAVIRIETPTGDHPDVVAALYADKVVSALR